MNQQARCLVSWLTQLGGTNHSSNEAGKRKFGIRSNKKLDQPGPAVPDEGPHMERRRSCNLRPVGITNMRDTR